MPSPLLDIIRLDEFDFDHHTDWHGVDHAINVVNYVRSLGSSAGADEQLIRTVECAGLIHDMARQHDRECEDHGRWAVESKLPVWRKTFLDYGLSDDDFPALAFAVTYHCRHDAPTNAPYLPYLVLLKKADAEDLRRFPWYEGSYPG